jgi:DNA-binding MarR family transcriptional regulator
MNDQTLQRAANLEDLLPKILRSLTEISTDPLADISLSQLRVLRIISECGGTPTAISQDLGLTVSAVTQIANRLERRGLIARSDDPVDRRIKHLALSDSGRELMKRRREMRTRRAAAILCRLPEGRQDELLRSLNELLWASNADTEVEEGS